MGMAAANLSPQLGRCLALALLLTGNTSTATANIPDHRSVPTAIEGSHYDSAGERGLRSYLPAPEQAKQAARRLFREVPDKAKGLLDRSTRILKGSHIRLTLIDLHPAHNRYTPNASHDPQSKIASEGYKSIRPFQHLALDGPIVLPTGAGVQRIGIWYQGTGRQRFDALIDLVRGPGEESYVPLWGLNLDQTGDGQSAIINNTGKPIRGIALTNGYARIPATLGLFRDGPISHSEMPMAYSLALLEDSARSRGDGPPERCVDAP